MTDIIQLLPDHVANQIAAGEVVQRPASIVKELLENAIDAKATTITLIVKDAGKTLVQVTDDGIGMSVTDARLSFERHATSKIKSAEDLFNLHTKGFRGEALASIAAIAHVELKTRTAELEIGTHLTIEGSKVIAQDPAVVPKGTTISVKNLFYNIPARRNFLKSNVVEMRHIIDEFHRVAMAHPSVAFQMLHNGSDVFNLPASNARQRIVHIFGSKTNEKLVPVNEETDILKIDGFVIKPEYGKKSRGEQFFFVNDRFIKSPYLHHAVSSAFEGLMRNDVHPGYFLFLQVDPHSIDINIHPTKTEIKFDDEHSIYAMLRATVKHGLGQFNIAPVLDFERDKGFDTPYEYGAKNPKAPSVEVDRDFNPFQDKPSQGRITFPFERNRHSGAGNTSSWESLYIGTKDDINPTPFSDKNSFETQMEFESEEVTGSFFENSNSQNRQVTFQLQNKYIVSPLKNGLMVIHQHLAHQRILYEELLKNITVKEAVSQQLLFPLQLHFSRPDVEIISKIKEQLEHTGFVFSELRDENIEISGIPVMIVESHVVNLLQELIEDIKRDVPENGYSQNDLLAKSMAASMAIKSGVSLNREEQEHLINQLFACKEPTVSPMNRAVFTIIGLNEIDNKFV